MAIAHRQELVGQISCALARQEIKHRIIAPISTIRFITGLHINELNKTYYDPTSTIAVASVDTLIRRSESWFKNVKLWVQDEAHHVLKSNKWGRAVKLFPNARGLGVTATPERADGKGLSIHTEGLFENLIVGPSMRDIINQGFLTDYKIYAPLTSNLDLSTVNITKIGDYNQNKLKAVVRKSRIIGDVVDHYKRLAAGRLGITFVTDIDTAQDIADQYSAAGVPAAVITYLSSASERAKLLAEFKARRILQLVNIDLFGEGFDLPAVEVVSFARPTCSYGLYAQQFGRALRIMEGKKEALIIDHVGNVFKHGLPDSFRQWSLDGRKKSAREITPVKVCSACTAVYERIYKICPYCGHYAAPLRCTNIEQVDGDLLELSSEALEALRRQAQYNIMPVNQYRAQLIKKHCPTTYIKSHVKHHLKKLTEQEKLRSAIALWAAYQRQRGQEDSISYRQFYFKFGTDVLTAQTLNTADTIKLKERINADLETVGS